MAACILSDPAFMSMTPTERLLFVGCITIADDDGRLPGSPRHLLGVIFGGDLNLNERTSRALRDSVSAKCPNFVVYRVGGHEYIAFRRWFRYQKPSHPTPSRLPPPTEPGFYDPPASSGDGA